jgi:hypothetical protein
LRRRTSNPRSIKPMRRASGCADKEVTGNVVKKF